MSGLPPNEQAVYWTGAVARSDVELEHELAGVYVRLATGLAWVAAPTGVSPLANAVRRMIESDEFSDDRVRDVALRLLGDVNDAHAERNRLVHDLWANDSSIPEIFDRLMLRGRKGSGAATRHLADFKRCADSLRLCGIRVTALGLILDTFGSPLGEIQQVWWEVLSGNVALTEGGGFSVTSER